MFVNRVNGKSQLIQIQGTFLVALDNREFSC